MSIYCAPSHQKTSKRFSESQSCDLPWKSIFLVNSIALLLSKYCVPSYYILKLSEKVIFLGKLTNAAIVYLLCPIMTQCFKKILKVVLIMRYKASQFWAKSDPNQPFNLKGHFLEKLTEYNVFYLMYLIIRLSCFQKNH